MSVDPIRRQAHTRTAVCAAGLLLALVVVVGIATRADASSPGSNGVVVFSSDRDGDNEIYSMLPSGGSVTKLTDNTASDTEPEISPDGSKIVFTSNRDGNDEIYYMNIDGTGQTRVTNAPASSEVDPTWEPATGKITYAGNAEGGDYDIYTGMALDGTGSTEVTTGTAQDDRYPDYSSIASPVRMVYQRRVPASPNNWVGVYRNGTTTPRPFSAQGSVNLQHPTFKPGSNTDITYANDGDGDYEVYTATVTNPTSTSPDLTVVTKLTDNGAADMKPAFSPDGTQIAFQSDRDGNNEIYSMTAAGGSQTRLTNDAGSDAAPAWQPSNAPETTISSGPAEGSRILEDTATFGFSSSAPSSTFECKLDNGSYASCSSPYTTPTLADGDHTFSVRATDSQGLVDPTPAQRNFSSGALTDPKLSLAPGSASFGSKLIDGGATAGQAFTVTNTGADGLQPQTAALTGVNADQFTITNDGCHGQTLNASDTCTVTVAFDPSTVGSKSATLSIASNDPSSPATSSLSGTGTTPATGPITQVFTGMDSPSVSCTVQTSSSRLGQRWCTATSSRVRSWDGTPIDISVGLPPAPASGPDGNFPVIGMYHGWAGSKLTPGNENPQQYINDGFAVFSMSDRGWGTSCGTAASRNNLPSWATCAHGYVHMDGQAFEARDAQYLLGELADEGVIDPQRIGAWGASYGGILSVQLGALKNRTRLEDGSLVPWTSPNGTPMQIAGAAPQALYSSTAEALIPNGSSLDYVADSPYLGPNGDGRVGVQKATIMNGFLNASSVGYFAPAGLDPTADIFNWRTWSTPPGPFDTPQMLGAIHEMESYHSAMGVDDSVAPAPMLLANGLWDDFVPADESVRYYNKIRTSHPETPMGLFFGDFGHAKSNDKAADNAKLDDLQEAWLKYYVKGVGSQPAGGLDTFVMTCPSSAADGGPLHFSSYADMEKGEVRLQTTTPQTISATGTQFGDELSQPGSNTCDKVSATDNAATANYRTAAAPAGGYTVAGGTTVIAKLNVTGQSDQIAARLLDVGTDGKEQLIERGLYRPKLDNGTNRQVFQLHPNVFHIDQGHVLKLELLPDDSPYSSKNSTSPDSAAQHPITVNELDLRVPTLDTPGSAGGMITAPAPKFLPSGYTLARDFDADAPPQTTIDSGPSGPTSTSSPQFAFSSDPSGATFECRLDIGSTEGDWGSCTSPKTYTGLGEGDYTFNVRATDSHGHVDPTPATSDFTVDATPPETTIDSGPADGATITSASPSFGFSSSESGSSFECKLDTGAFSSCNSPKSLSGLSDGPHTFSVRATDAASNTDASPASRTFTVDTSAPDTTPPETTIDSGPADGATINSASASFDFSSSESGSSYECKLDAGAFTSCDPPKDLSALDEGSHTFSVRATDAALNTDQSPATRTFTVDTTAPDTAIDTGPSGTTSNRSPQFTYHSSESGSTFECSLDTGTPDYAACFPSGFAPASALSDGDYTFRVRATDGAGNLDDSAATRNFTVDATPPETTIDTGPTGTTSNRSPQFTYHSSESGSSFECSLDTGIAAWQPCDGSAFTPASPLADGDYTFRVRATDAPGNVDQSPATRTFTVDASAPETTIDSGPTGTTSDRSPQFTYHSSESGSSFECSLDTGTADWHPCDSAGFTPASPLADGDYTFRVRATDGPGNTDGSPATRTFTVDATAPDTTIDSGPTGTTTSPSPQFTYHSSESGSSFECSLDSGTADWHPCDSAGFTPASPLADGDYTFRVRATDGSGNTDGSPATRTFTVDATAPETTIDTGPTGTTSDRSPQFTYHSSESGSSFECSLDTGIAAWQPCDGSGFTPASPLSSGSYTFRVRATDGPGNTDGSPATRSFTVDATAPETTIDSGPTGTTTSRSPQFTYHSSESGSTFECSLDTGTADWHSCASAGFTPASPLADGSYTFRVRATDGLGNLDQSAATRSFTVDATAPDTTIDTGPTGETDDTTPQFTYHSSENGSTFECSLDGDGSSWSACASSGFSPTAPLAAGSHVFRVRATDAAGNVDGSPASRSFTVKAAAPPKTAPETILKGHPKSKLKTKKKKLKVKFSFSSDAPGATFTCSLDGKSSSCSSPAKYKVKPGSHTFEVAAVADGLTDQSPARYKFKVKRKR